MTKYIVEIKVVGLEKIRKDIAGKRYEFVLKVRWSNNTEAVIYRPHSMFFDFQGVVTEMFKNEKIPSAPAYKFHWALLGKLGNEKECKSMEEFCMKIIHLPPIVSRASIVLHFFETWGTDARTNQKSTELFDPVVGRTSIKSQEQWKPNAISDDKEEQFKIVANYDASNVGEISLSEGKSVNVIEKNERGWWFVADDLGNQGWAPATYLEPMMSVGEDTGYDWVSVTDVNGRGESYVAMVSYTPQNDDELSYSATEEVEVLEKSNYGWWRVRIDNRIGITPATNLQRVNETCLYSSADELDSRTVSISDTSGLYAVIRKPPPRRESVRSRSSSGIASSPTNSLNQNSGGLRGKKPSRFVYSATSFAGGNFVIGEEDKENQPQARRDSSFEKQPYDAYVNVNKDTIPKAVNPKPIKSGRSSGIDDGLQSVQLHNPDQIVVDHISYVNRRFSKAGDGAEVQIYSALLDYIPSHQTKDDLFLNKGDIVQLVSTDSGWMFVTLITGDVEKQGWVPENYLERRYDIDQHEFVGKGDRKPKPRPRPLPRPKNKAVDHQNSQLKPLRAAPEPPKRTSLPDILKPLNMPRSSLPDINQSRSPESPSTPRNDVAKRMAGRPPMPVPLLDEIRQVGAVEEDVYDEPEMLLRSVYDSEPWYHGNISRIECEKILSTYGRQREFLIRESQRGVGYYSLSVKYCYRIRHFGIQPKDAKFIIGSKSFPNLLEIVSYYQQNALFFSEHNESICLGQPFPKDRIPK